MSIDYIELMQYFAVLSCIMYEEINQCRCERCFLKLSILLFMFLSSQKGEGKGFFADILPDLHYFQNFTPVFSNQPSFRFVKTKLPKIVYHIRGGFAIALHRFAGNRAVLAYDIPKCQRSGILGISHIRKNFFERPDIL